MQTEQGSGNILSRMAETLSGTEYKNCTVRLSSVLERGRGFLFGVTAAAHHSAPLFHKHSFMIAPDGSGAVAAEPIKTNAQARAVSESLNILLGAHSEGATHSTAPENGFLELPVGNITRIHTSEVVRTLAEAGVKDFADALNISRTTHAGGVR